ncbi:hypothetical protein PHYSODRAFT_258795 [Phytophthora sojae]|uniref:Uncharacterized protein n=1 Tax=Phytophthora sojae (strain P6497) TaxID=1094619 RepID=G4ZVW8_PHYSP|nr:hypothetical protein PHYSODRAFT_258795 [Phytophthora sojae]EGZ12304.1 hypothetical protein PHYSODRAFT_258795 [Phytophthora sojae]|eukprot:XP_009532637.1 hypothetical protein PHYSODRAFT_258795 [Phytophthora sojae]
MSGKYDFDEGKDMEDAEPTGLHRAAAFEALEQMLALQSEQTDWTFKVFKCIVKLTVAVAAALVVTAALGQRPERYQELRSTSTNAPGMAYKENKVSDKSGVGFAGLVGWQSTRSGWWTCPGATRPRYL